MLCAINAAAVAEASILMMKAGLDPTQMMRDVIQNSSGTSSELADSADAFLARDFEPGFTVDLLLKDVLLGVDFAKEVGLSMNSADAAVRASAADEGRGNGRQVHVRLDPPARA